MPRPNVPDRLIEEVESLHENRQGYQAGSFQEALATVIDMATPELADEVALIAAKAYPEDSGLNVARLHPKTLQQLNLEPGSPVQIAGERRTAATAKKLQRADRNQATIRIDGFVRENAGVESGECVRVRRAEAVSDAGRVAFELPERGVEDVGPSATGLVGRQVTDRVLSTGDVVPVAADPESGGPAIPLRVVETEPDAPVVVRESTALTLEGSGDER